jgi:V/A-type H+-transporting ATPase subunit F
VSGVYKIGVIGDRDSVIGFRALAMTVLETDDPQEAGRLISQLAKENYAAIFITENLAEANMNILNELRKQKLPAIVPIPSLTGSTGLGMRQVHESVRRAVGMDLLAHEESTFGE